MRRFALAIIVALLACSASGVSSLVIPEPCTGDEQAGRQDDDCAPTCVTCGCCAQAAEPVLVVATSSPQLPVAEIVSALPRLGTTEPRAILHVPKSRLA